MFCLPTGGAPPSNPTAAFALPTGIPAGTRKRKAEDTGDTNDVKEEEKEEEASPEEKTESMSIFQSLALADP